MGSVTHFFLFKEYVKEQTSFTSILTTIYLDYLSPLDDYFRIHQKEKSIPVKNKLSMLESPTAIANNLQSAGKLASSSRPPRGRASLNTIVTEPPKSV